DGAICVRLQKCGSDAELIVSYDPPASDEVPGDLNCVENEFDDLSVARHVTAMLVEAHGGTVSEESDGGNTVVHIRIPALAEHQAGRTDLPTSSLLTMTPTCWRLSGSSSPCRATRSAARATERKPSSASRRRCPP